jgi:hypothetical protein
MTAQGLLVKGTHGEDYLLKTEQAPGTSIHRLIVLKKINDQWEPVEGALEGASREAVIGALVDFLVDLCRVMNSSDCKPARSGHHHATGSALPQQGRQRGLMEECDI